MPSNGFAFGDPRPSPDNFDTFDPKDVFADSKIYVKAVPEPIKAPWRKPPVMSLDEVLGKAAVQQIQNSGRIVFHATGDTGGIKVPAHQFAVADAMTADLSGKDLGSGQPVFFFHLGDVVYYFGQERYYFDQFYDPYRDYNAPIFAIPGNHDGVMFPGETATYSLEAFWNNFCAQKPAHLSEAQGCVRTTMTQPGVYFTLDAPFVKIIGLYSNTSESTGVIKGQAAGMTDQWNFLLAQLKAAVTERKQGDQRALIIAVHHPPFTGSSKHFPSPGMLADMDAACNQAGILPDLVLSGHAHLYERYTRSVGGRNIPYVVAGNGGFYNLAGFKKGKNGLPPKVGVPGSDGKGNSLTLEAYDSTSFGFLRITATASTVQCESLAVNQQTRATSVIDSFTLSLNQPASKSPAASRRRGPRKKGGAAGPRGRGGKRKKR